jgi:hypothetical protein
MILQAIFIEECSSSFSVVLPHHFHSVIDHLIITRKRCEGGKLRSPLFPGHTRMLPGYGMGQMDDIPVSLFCFMII